MIREKCFIAHFKHFQTLPAFYCLKPVHRPPTIFPVEVALAHIWKRILRGIYSLHVQLGGGYSDVLRLLLAVAWLLIAFPLPC